MPRSACRTPRATSSPTRRCSLISARWRGPCGRAGSTSSIATCAPRGPIPRGAGPGLDGAGGPPCGRPSRPKDLNPVTQTFFEDMELEAEEDGRRHVYRQRHASRMVFPQELRALVDLAGGFEFVEWFYGFKPHLKLDRAHHPLLMVVVLRKR